MIDFEAIRVVMIDEGITPALGVPVVLGNQINKPPPYPFIVARFHDLTDQPSGHPATFVRGDTLVRTENVVFTVDFQTEATDTDVSARLALSLHDWFRTSSLLKDRFGISIARISGIDNRDLQLGEEWEYRHGFEVDFRVRNMIETPLAPLEAADIKEVDPIGP
ncbi:hypothetical protein GNP94_21985 [Paenibacillus campinasensis]|uniref:Phage neck terminator protein gp12-like domain-containing protein n=1 Tax=Paenibacillus campinasensis TaxID=66347 RepID=A0ABW9T8N4_9BACL|nr:hypothetical protein [Paenibacillus campinasensis]MUG68644.1 hypothetical protein [Paenibacillus campinasensis]